MIYRNKHLLAIKGILFKFPAVLINYIADIFGSEKVVLDYEKPVKTII